MLDRDTPIARIVPYAAPPLEIRKAGRRLPDVTLPPKPAKRADTSPSSLTTGAAVIAYIDTSALLRIVVRDAGALGELRTCDRRVSSELISVESARTID